MKVFVSSVITSFEAERAAVRDAIMTLGHEPVMAEDFGAQPNSPQVACLQGLRTAEVVVLVLGDRYGATQASGLSATHEEYREAKDSKPLLVFVKEGSQPEELQQALIDEVQGWVGGNLRSGFTNPSELATKVTRALHQFELATAVAPTDVNELKSLAVAKLPQPSRSSSYYVSAGPTVNIVVVFGPRQQILRPAQLEDAEFKEWLHQTVLFGAAKLLDPSTGTSVRIQNDALTVEQERGASVSLEETAEVLIQIPVDTERGRFSSINNSSVVIEEDIVAAFQSAIEFVQTLLDRVDSTQRLTHIALAASMSGGEHRAWRTRAEHAAMPNAVEIPWRNSDGPNFVVIDRKRGALQFDRQRLIEDIMVPLRRRWKK